MKQKVIALLAVLVCMLFSTAISADEPQPYMNGNITVDASEGVDIQLTRVRTANKITVKVAVETEDDFLVRGIKIVDSNGESLPFEVVGQYLYTFEMPRCDVTIHITAEDYGYVTRAEGALAMWKLAGSPTTDYLPTYCDVDADAEYAEAVRWALSEGLMTGVDDEHYSPDDLLCRENLAVMLYEYAKSRSLDTSAAAEYEIETIDRSFISEDAYDGVCYAVSSGIMEAENRTAGYFNPQGELFRFEFDDILKKFSELIESDADRAQEEPTGELNAQLDTTGELTDET